jgi:hypothetical protein
MMLELLRRVTCATTEMMGCCVDTSSQVKSVSRFCADPSAQMMELQLPEDVARCPMHRKVVHGICRWHDVASPPQIVCRKPEGRLMLLPPSPIGLSAAITAC